MNQLELEKQLQDLPLGAIRYFDSITSTNDEAANWIKAGAPDLALVVADEQTAGRGRRGRKWFTPAESALAFSLILRSQEQMEQIRKYQNTARLNGLGALAVCLVLQSKLKLSAQIKWPNDILVNGKKISGVLAEAHWIGSELTAVALGIGINVLNASVPAEDWDTLNPHPFPATSVEAALGTAEDRLELLYAVLDELLTWRKQLSKAAFLQAWQANLAFQDQWVQIIAPGLDSSIQSGKIIALEEDGALQLQDEFGARITLRAGEIQPADSPFDRFRLRPVDSSEK